MQIINKFDSCCFAGVRYRTYEPAMQAAMKGMGGGAFGVFLDDSHRKHTISMHALEKAVAPVLPKD